MCVCHTLIDQRDQPCADPKVLISELACVCQHAQTERDLLYRAARFIFSRHAMVSGSAEMAECDAVCKAAGFDVWTWPSPGLVSENEIPTLDTIEALLVRVSNALYDMKSAAEKKDMSFIEHVDEIVDKATRLVQDRKEAEAEDRNNPDH